MPVITDDEDLQKVYLPSTSKAENEEDRAWVVLDISSPTGKDLATMETRDSSGQTLLKGLLRRIKEWNYVTADGQPLTIDFETLQRLDLSDITYLNDQVKSKSKVTPLSNDEKKA